MTHYVGVVVRLFFVCALTLPSLLASNSAVDRCLRAARVLDSVMGTPEKAIPQGLMSRSHCVAIIPGVKKAGFVIGGHYGKGVLSCRGANGFGWTAPSAVRIEGGSFGLQIGGSSTDLVLLILNKRGAEKLVGSRFTLGADAAVAGGPVGRSAQAQTDAHLQAEILSYSRSKGLFAGISLEGATLRPAHGANERLYGEAVDPKQVLAAAGLTPPATIQPLMDALNRYSSAKHR